MHIKAGNLPHGEGWPHVTLQEEPTPCWLSAIPKSCTHPEYIFWMKLCTRGAILIIMGSRGQIWNGPYQSVFQLPSSSASQSFTLKHVAAENLLSTGVSVELLLASPLLRSHIGRDSRYPLAVDSVTPVACSRWKAGEACNLAIQYTATFFRPSPFGTDRRACVRSRGKLWDVPGWGCAYCTILYH